MAFTLNLVLEGLAVKVLEVTGDDDGIMPELFTWYELLAQILMETKLIKEKPPLKDLLGGD